MITPLRLAVGLALLAFIEPACKKNAASVDADTAPPEAPVDFVGRCVNETADTPYQSIFFFPKTSEMFMYLGTTGSVRVPISVTEQTARKVSFTLRWSEKDESPKTHTGSVSASGNKWSFDFDTLKDSLCHPAPAPDFNKLLPDLGITAGKWEDKKAHFAVVVAADAQTIVLFDKGTPVNLYYRVLESGTNGVLIAANGPKTPDDSDDEFWTVSRLKREGDTLVHELKDSTLHYKLVAAAPKLQ